MAYGSGIGERSGQDVDEIDSLAAEAWTARRLLLRDLPRDFLSCIAIGAVLTLILTPFLGGGFKLWINSFVFNTIISVCIGLSVSNAFRFGLQPLRRRFPGAVSNALIHAILAIGSTTLGAELAVRLLDGLAGMRAEDFRADVFRIAFVVVAIILTGEISYSRLRRKARRDELRAQQAQKQALLAEIKALQARTNPHFLFNSLNTVAGLIEENPEGAERVLEKLAGLFRYALRGTEVGWVRLGEEVEAVESYLDVEQVRLGDRLRSRLEVSPEAREVLVPSLILQPLVENAVVHAIAPRKSGGCVRVEADLASSFLTLAVRDDGDGSGSSPHRGSGTSLSALANRLALLYADTADFSAGSRADGGFEVRFKLPIEIET